MTISKHKLMITLSVDDFDRLKRLTGGYSKSMIVSMALKTFEEKFYFGVRPEVASAGQVGVRLDGQVGVNSGVKPKELKVTETGAQL